MTKQEEIREKITEIIALSDNDVRPRTNEIIALVSIEIIDWLIERRRKLQEKKCRLHQLKPNDIQGEIQCSIKARALQEVINYLNSILVVEPLLKEG